MAHEATEIARLRDATQEIADALDALLRQLRPQAPPFALEHLRHIVQSETSRLFVATTGGRIAGMLTLIVAPVPSGWHAYIEEVIVDEAARGQGLAGRLVDTAIDAAARTGASRVDLTSNPTRHAANALYRKLGFEQRNTNVYRYAIDEA